MDENLFSDLFRRPDGRPFRRPRFGAGMPPSDTLPVRTAEMFSDATPSPLFDLQRDLPDLGLTVRVTEREGERGSELWAVVRSTNPAGAGKEVCVALVGVDDAVMKVLVPVGAQRRLTGWYGEALVGRLDEVRDALGADVTLDAFVLD